MQKHVTAKDREKNKNCTFCLAITHSEAVGLNVEPGFQSLAESGPIRSPNE